MREFVSLVKALSDESRLRALLALRGRELCVCQIVELLQLAPSTVSKHMSILKQANLVQRRKEGRWMYYSLAGDDAPASVREAITWFSTSLKKDATVREDIKQLKEILRLDPEKLCKLQCSK